MQYRPVSEGGSRERTDFTRVTVDQNSASSYILANLEESVCYEINVAPYYDRVAGRTSRSVRACTKQAPPSSSPRNVQAKVVDGTTMLVSWDPPKQNDHNGPLLGYKVLHISLASSQLVPDC